MRLLTPVFAHLDAGRGAPSPAYTAGAASFAGIPRPRLNLPRPQRTYFSPALPDAAQITEMPMLAWLLTLSLTALGPLVPEGQVVAPVDVVAGQQTIALRAPLVARTPGARLVLFVRDLSGLETRGLDRMAAFEHALPPGSVSARLRSGDGRELELHHTAYLYHRGLAGLVLTEATPGQGNTLYASLEVDAARALPGVQFVWLDSLARDVRDTRQLR